jgi:hypothetical protein
MKSDTANQYTIRSNRASRLLKAAKIAQSRKATGTNAASDYISRNEIPNLYANEPRPQSSSSSVQRPRANSHSYGYPSASSDDDAAAYPIPNTFSAYPDDEGEVGQASDIRGRRRSRSVGRGRSNSREFTSTRSYDFRRSLSAGRTRSQLQTGPSTGLGFSGTNAYDERWDNGQPERPFQPKLMSRLLSERILWQNRGTETFEHR